MIIEGVKISTPCYEVGDDPAWYYADWRNKIATTLAEKKAKIPKPFKGDKYIQMGVAYFTALRSGKYDDNALAAAFPAYHVALGWSTMRDANPTRYRADALLLCRESIDVLANAIKIPTALMQTYERCFWNVRNADDLPINVFALLAMGVGTGRLTDGSPPEAHWRYHAMTGGYAMLVMKWGTWNTAYTVPDSVDMFLAIQQAGQMELLRKINNLDAQGLDIVAGISHNIEHSRQLLEARRAGDSRQTGFDMLQKIFELYAPQMARMAVGGAQQAEQSAALQRKLLAERNIQATNIVDMGLEAGYRETSRQVQQSLQDAASTAAAPQVKPVPPNNKKR